MLTRYQSPDVPGVVNLTCDGWQASNTDGYLAVTAHWVQSEKHHPDEWNLRMALIGFVQMNSAHNGANLGQVVFKVTERLQITIKVIIFFDLMVTVSRIRIFISDWMDYLR